MILEWQVVAWVVFSCFSYWLGGRSERAMWVSNAREPHPVEQHGKLYKVAQVTYEDVL